jgi:hypothetical protein
MIDVIDDCSIEGDPALPGGYSRDVLEQMVPAAREFADWIVSQIRDSGERRIEVILSGVAILNQQLTDAVIERYPERAGGIDDAVAWVLQSSIDQDLLVSEQDELAAAELAARELNL